MVTHRTGVKVVRERLAALDASQMEHFIPLCPDFVIELRSPSDRLDTLQSKLEEYVANGARLGWLIDPTDVTVYVYRPGQAAAVVRQPTRMPGDPELSGFVLDMSDIWRTGV